MAPPDRSESPRRDDSRADLVRAKLDEGSGSRLSSTANRLASWVEWLRHPEEHEHDRLVFWQEDGIWKEESERKNRRNPGMGPGQPASVERPYKSVIDQYTLLQFLDGMASVAPQQVESDDNHLALGTAAINNVWWLGNARITELAIHLPSRSEWSGTAGENARDAFGKLSTIATQINKIAAELTSVAPQYALSVKTARDNFQKAADNAIQSFQDKFYAKKESTSLDVLGIALAGVAAGVVAFTTGGTALVVGTAAVATAWAKTMEEGGKKLAGDAGERRHGAVNGFLWRDLGGSYMLAQEAVQKDTIAGLETLRQKLHELNSRFSDIRKLIEELPQIK